MLDIKTIPCNILAENCYIVSDETKECIFIDCGAQTQAEYDYIASLIMNDNLIPKEHLLTHAHFDHIMGVPWLYEKYHLLPMLCSEEMYNYTNHDDAKTFGFAMHQCLPPAKKLLNDGDEISFGNHTLKAIHTPGHSKGGMVFYCQEEKACFTGDTLFRGSIGRTDLAGGNMFQIIQSLRKITQLPDDTVIYPGHGHQSTIELELATNPYLDR